MVEKIETISPDNRNEVKDARNIPYQPLSLVFGAAVVGILLDRFSGIPGSYWTAMFILALLGQLFAHRRGWDLGATVLTLAAASAFFGFWHHERWNRFSENDIGFFAREAGFPIALEGIVVEMPRVLPRPPLDPGRVIEMKERTLFTIRAKRLRDKTDWIDISGKASVVVEGRRDDLRIGDTVRIFGSLSKPIAPRNPGDFNYVDFLRSKRILCIVRAGVSDAVTVLKPGCWNLSPIGAARFLESVRRQARSNLERSMNSRTVSHAKAMLLGMREGVDEDTTQYLMETGTMHILAISGLHVGLVALTLAFLLGLFGVDPRKTALVLIGVVVLYLFLTDVRPPAIRATVLVCTVSVAVFTGRRSYGVNTLCFTALVVLLLNPTELFQFGAQLSFLATGAFLWIPSTKSIKVFFWRIKRKPAADLLADEALASGRWFIVELIRHLAWSAVSVFLVSLTVWAVTMPLILEKIHLFTPIALAVNPLLWLPLTAALLCGFAAMLFGWIPGIDALFGFAADMSFDLLFGMIESFRDLGGHYHVPGPPAWWNAVFYAVFVVLTFLPVRRPRAKILVSLLIFWIAVGWAAGWIRDIDRLRNDRLTFAVFSVGHGNCVLVVTPQKKTIVYDVGCLSSPKRVADILSRGLWRLGKTDIDAVVVSHADSDHYNGVVHLAERFRIGAVLVSPYMFVKDDPSLELFRKTLRERKIPLVEVGDGDDLSLYGLADSKIVHPPKREFAESDSSNAASLVLTFRHQGVGALFPGDLDGRLMPDFLTRTPEHFDIIMVPHHGGRSKQTERLLEWSTPEILLISAGRLTHRDETLNGLRQRGYAVRSTFEEGYIEISIAGHKD